MTDPHEKTPAGVPITDQGREKLCTGISTTDSTPPSLALVPSDGNDWWHYELHVNGRPAIRFNSGTHAMDTLAYAVDDVESGVDLATHQALDDLAGGALRPRDYNNGTRYEIAPGRSHD